MTPKRWQRSWAKGTRQPDSCRYCGRGTIYGNPFEIMRLRTREQVISLYAQELDVIICNLGMTAEEFFAPLMEYEWLSCFCSLDEACHVEVLIERIQRMTTFQQMEMEL